MALLLDKFASRGLLGLVVGITGVFLADWLVYRLDTALLHGGSVLGLLLINDGS